MTYQAPAGRRQTARCPQHAAPFGGSTPVRLHAHRALRLVVAAGAWTAGLCLIIASVALVAGAAGPARTAHLTTTAGRYSAPRSTGLTQPGGATHVLHTFSGIGDQRTPQFTVAAHSRWTLDWLYQCMSGRPGQQLLIREGDATGSGISVNATGASGHGSTSAVTAARVHYLVVITSCAWTARILGRG